MADGLSLAASVIAIVQLSGSCLKLSQKWLGPTEFSSPELATLKTTLFDFFHAITKFETRLGVFDNDQSRQGTTEYLPQVLERCKVALDTVQSFMNNRGFMGKYVIAPRFDGKMKAALKSLEAAKDLFLLALHADHQALLLKIHQVTQLYAEGPKDFQDDTTNTLKRMHDNAEERGRESKRFREDSRAFQDNALNSLKTLEESFCKMVSTIPTQSAEELLLLRDEENRKFMESLKFDQIDARHSTIRNAHAKTCEWVLENREYNDWLDASKHNEHGGFIWVRGKPGAGKSTLMKFLFAQAKRKMKDVIIISFFFNARGGDLEKSTVGMYRSLLFQLLTHRPELQNVLAPVNPVPLDEHGWDLEPLKTMVEEAIRGLAESSLMIFIDALDECDECEIRNMISFFGSLGELATSINVQLRVCFSSRHYPHITIEKGLSLILEGQEGHGRDIINYVDTELRIGHSKLAQLIRTELQEKAQGVFMWVVLVVGILNKEHDRGNMHRLRKRLQDIPGDLHALFRSILTRDDDDRDRLLLCIQWVLFAREPLRPDQLHFAMYCDSESDIIHGWDPELFTSEVIQRSILDSSKGLIEVTKSEIATVQFIHESVKDFLLKNDGLREVWPDRGCDLEGRSHERLKRCCFAHMNIDVAALLNIPDSLPTASSRKGKELRQSANKRFPFLDYATRNLLYHADRAESGGITQESFLCDFKTILPEWITLKELFDEQEVRWHVRSVSLLYILAELNLAALIRILPREQSCFDVENSRYGLPFFAALATKSKEAVISLLNAEKRADPGNQFLQDLERKYSNDERERVVLGHDYKYSDRRGAFCDAAEYGDAVLLAFFLGMRKFDIEDKSTHSRTPLILATKGGHQAAVQLLVENGAKIEAKDNRGWRPLHYAASAGYEDTVLYLLKHGAELDAINNQQATPLILAYENGHESIVKILLEEGFQSKPGIRLTESLRSACEKGYHSLVAPLLEKGARYEAWFFDGPPPLIIASQLGHKDVVTVLLEKGDNIEARTDESLTPLLCASSQGHGGVVETLLEKGADIEARTESGKTPLLLAARAGHEGVVEILLGKGAYIEEGDETGRTPLIEASDWGHWDTVNILLENGADIEEGDETGKTPLRYASGSDRKGVVKLLLERGANTEAQDEYGHTVLMSASRLGNEGVVKLLLDKGANIGARDDRGRTALMEASEQGQVTIVQALLEKGANVDAQDENGKTALILASQRSRSTSIVESLLNRGASIGAQDKDGMTALMVASRNGRVAIVKALLKRGAAIDAGDNDGQTSLMLASRRGEVRTVGVLLKRGASIDARDKNGNTSLMLASQYGELGVVEVLLERGAILDLQNLARYKPLVNKGNRGAYKLVLERAKVARMLYI